MKKFVLLQSAVITALIVALLLVTFGSARSWQTGIAHAGTGSDETPSTDRTVEVASEPAAPTAGSTLVYFSPQDNDANATVVMLYNTTAVTQTVVVKGYAATGLAAT
jgi:hypothetical protein